MKGTIGQAIASRLKKLKIRNELPPELEEEFTSYKDIKSINRIQSSAWLGVVLTFCLFGLDLYRYNSGSLNTHQWYPWLVANHLIGLLFLVPAIHITLRKKWIIQTKQRRGIVIWGMVILSIVFMLGQAILVYLDRGTQVMFLGYIFIFTWMFSMSHKERIWFTIGSFSIMVIVIFYLKEGIDLDRRISNFFEVFFLSITAFIFDAFDFNLNLANFMNLREIEREQERVKKLEEFKTRFFTNLTHELRTPLTMISGMAREITEDPKRWAAEGSEIISRNAGNLLNLVNQILALSKIESGSMPLHLMQGDIVSYSGYVVDAFRGHAMVKRIKLHFLSEEADVIMDYDPEKYMTILSNLLSNAIKFTPEDGNVYITLLYRKRGIDSVLELTVRDTGIGIPPDELEHIFERFYQAQNEMTGSGIGTGIGLSLVYEFVKMLEGEIQVKSSTGKGTTFMVSLPVRKEAALEGRPLIKEEIKTNISFYLPPGHTEEVFVQQEIDDKPDILIIEDNADVIKYLQICLGELYQITYCKDGQSGIDKAIEIVPDLILSDVLMPVKDGLVVCRELKSNPVTSHIPIVLLSAKVDPESRIAGLESGADVYMLKPFEKQELKIQLHNLLEQRQEFHRRYADPTREPGRTTEATTPTREDQFVSKARAIVHEHLDDSEFSVTHFCRAIFLSRTQLHKKLTALTGLSATHFIRQIRLYTAQQMVKTSDLSITDIAYKVGFTDPNYFTRCYTQEFGEAPTETRSILVNSKI